MTAPAPPVPRGVRIGRVAGVPVLVSPSWLLFAAVTVAAAALAIGASVSPARRALNVPPVVALAVE